MNPLKWSPYDSLKWIALALIIRLGLFLFFNHEFHLHWRQDMLHGIVVHHNDTDGYFTPLEAVVAGEGYNSPCRMPGLLPIYWPLRLVFSASNAQTVVIVLQLILGALSAFLLAKSAFVWTNSNKVFKTVFFLYAISSFVSIWDHAAISDSFSVNFLVVAIYFLSQFYINKSNRLVLVAGFFLAWSVFFRPAHLLVYPAFACLLWAIHGLHFNGFKKAFAGALILTAPFAISDALWINHNYQRYERFVWLQDDDQLCFGSLAPYHIAVRDMIIQRGGDFKEWSVNTELAWIMDADSTSNFAFDPSFFTSNYSLDSLKLLKQHYTVAADRSLENHIRVQAQNQVMNLANNMAQEYKEEAKFRYYFVNRIKQIRRFIFSGNVDNLPFPSRSKMSWIEFAVKSFYTLLLHSVVVVFLCASVFFCYKRNWILLALSLFPWILILLLGGVLGYAEQRYLTPAYPFMLIIGASFLFRKTALKPSNIS